MNFSAYNAVTFMIVWFIQEKMLRSGKFFINHRARITYKVNPYSDCIKLLTTAEEFPALKSNKSLLVRPTFIKRWTVFWMTFNWRSVP